MSSSEITQVSRPQLKLFSGEAAPDEPGRLWPGMSLTAFFRLAIRPQLLARARPRNVEQYDESTRLWAELTGDPPLTQIDDAIRDLFDARLAERPGKRGRTISHNTRRKHAITIQAVLDRAAPYSRRDNPHGKGLIDDPPRLFKPAVVKSDFVERFTLLEISRLLAVCHLARRPRIAGISAKDWWLAAILLDYNTGLRPETLLELRWEWVVELEGLWFLDVPAWAIKGRSHARKFYLNASARTALALVRGERERVLPWPYSIGYLHQIRRELLEAAEIDPRRRFGFKGLRKALGTELGKISEIASKMALGHAGGDITIGFYQHVEILVDALERLPQPAWQPDREGDQLLLF